MSFFISYPLSTRQPLGSRHDIWTRADKGYDMKMTCYDVFIIYFNRGNKMNCELMLTYDTPALRQTGYGVPIWSLWPNIRFLPSIVAEKNATKNGHIQNVCSMCIKINKVDKQEVGIWWVQKHFPQYGIPISSLWPNIRFLSSIVA
jgi:hypothetical protein